MTIHAVLTKGRSCRVCRVADPSLITPLSTQKAMSETLTFLRRHSGPTWVPAHLSLVVQIRPHLREKGSTISHSLEAAGVNQGGLQPKHIGILRSIRVRSLSFSESLKFVQVL